MWNHQNRYHKPWSKQSWLRTLKCLGPYTHRKVFFLTFVADNNYSSLIRKEKSLGLKPPPILCTLQLMQSWNDCRSVKRRPYIFDCLTAEELIGKRDSLESVWRGSVTVCVRWCALTVFIKSEDSDKLCHVRNAECCFLSSALLHKRTTLFIISACMLHTVHLCIYLSNIVMHYIHIAWISLPVLPGMPRAWY